MIDLGIEYSLPQGQQLPLKVFTKTLITDYTTPSCNREYSESAPGDIPDLQLHGYSDAVFTDLVNRKLIFGYIYKLVGGPVLYKLSK
jgi:hypothetical protein